MTSIEQVSLKNYLVTHNYKKIINAYIIFAVITTIILLLISIKYKYETNEEYLSKRNKNQLLFEIDNDKIKNLDKYELKINDENINYELINIEQGINKSIITIQPEKQKCDSTYCKIILIRKEMTLKKAITEKIKEMI